MSTPPKKQLLLHPLFLLSLLLLILNDAWLKWMYHNTLTGKLSDFSGLFAFSIVLFILLPEKWDTYTCLISAVFFILWKSPFTTLLLEWINQNPWLHFGRVLDYTDWWAISVLPLANKVIQERISFRPTVQTKPVLHFFILTTALFSFSATSLIRYEMPRGDVFIGENYKVKMPKDSVLSKLEQMGYLVTIDSAFQDTFTTRRVYDARNIRYYQIESVALTEYDTLASLRFNLYPEKKGKHCRINVINITLQQPGHSQDWRQLKQAWQFYRKSIKRNLVKKIE